MRVPKTSGFAEWSRWDASDMDPRSADRVSGSERVKRPTVFESSDLFLFFCFLTRSLPD